MSKDDRTDAEWSVVGVVTRYRDVIEHDGHAWVLANDAERWFYECLKCADRVHVLTIAEMNKAFENHYAYLPLKYRAPWNWARDVEMFDGGGTSTVEHRPPYPACQKPDAPVPDVKRLERGPVVAVPQQGARG
ncbi:MAG TPA: hypothetical protein VLQ52_06800 [Coriobacteriia bacterium]|nr:hypothetical protein [Coriobacteriia bacterium]